MYNLLIIKIISLLIFVNVYGNKYSELVNKNIIHQENICIAYFASGCFWCVESIYEDFKGVMNVTSGYAGGYLKNPTYRQVIGGKTGHAETVRVTYNPNIISFSKLVEIFFYHMIQLQKTDKVLTLDLTIVQSHFMKMNMKKK